MLNGAIYQDNLGLPVFEYISTKTVWIALNCDVYFLAGNVVGFMDLGHMKDRID